MNLPPGCHLSVEKNPSWPDREFVDERLGDHNAPFLADHRHDYFGLFVRDDVGTIRAGFRPRHDGLRLAPEITGDAWAVYRRLTNQYCHRHEACRAALGQSS